MRTPEESAVDRIVQHLPGDWERASAALRERADDSGLQDVDVVVLDVKADAVTLEVRGRCAGAAQAARAEADLLAVAAASTGAAHA